MPDQSPKRGALPSPRSVLAAAVPYKVPIGAPTNFVVLPKQISFWDNYNYGDCVTAEEAFAKACNNPEIFISQDEVVAWATSHNVLNGAYLTQVMNFMQDDGFVQGAFTDDDGPYFSVDWTDASTLESAIATGPVKLGVAGDQLLTVWDTAGGARPAVTRGGSPRGSSPTQTKTTASRFAATVRFRGWHNSLAYRSLRESTGRSQAMRCSPGTL